MPAVCKPVVEDDRGQAEKLADSRGSGDPSSGDSAGEWKVFILPRSATKPERASPKKFSAIKTYRVLHRLRRMGEWAAAVSRRHRQKFDRCVWVPEIRHDYAV
jgi:hypothetical protein